MNLTPFEENKQFLTDGKTIFYQNYGMSTPKPIPEVNAASFKIHTNGLAQDKNKVYAITTMHEGLQIFKPEDIESVVFLGSSYFADNYNLYYYNEHFIEFCHVNAHDEIKKTLQNKLPEADAWWNRNEAFYKALIQVKYNVYTSAGKFFYHFKESKQLYDYPTYKTEVFSVQYGHFAKLFSGVS